MALKKLVAMQKWTLKHYKKYDCPNSNRKIGNTRDIHPENIFKVSLYIDINQILEK